ncbi:hypothetical protein SKAU_G00290550 [Synaphobranchus kaupii]|uniref:Uncharacterized protein n=1 Tax=Synaphobranchus kaupii TaxID=118154 RepID=A0A9Q1ILA3_SYNKA|nr:hypothetical protein SKAU_G00290550 [Synaphobranchus kaupii]
MVLILLEEQKGLRGGITAHSRPSHRMRRAIKRQPLPLRFDSADRHSGAAADKGCGADPVHQYLRRAPAKTRGSEPP